MFRHRIISAVLLSVFAAQALAQNPDTPQSKPSADTPPAKPAAPSSADAALDDVVVEAVYENPADKPFRTSGSSAYLSEQDVQRFRGTSMGDFLSGIPGVLNGDGRNSGAMDVNIRGMQGQGRVPVIVDGASQEATIWHGYNGAVSRTYLDPDLISTVEVEKGAGTGADATGTSGGLVRISTIGAKDIVLPGRKFGIRLKGGLNTNSRKTPQPGTLGGFWSTKSFDYSNRTYIPPAELFYPARGTERPSLKAAGFNGSIAAAWDSEHIELLAAYARRKNGNYFAGKQGADADVIIFNDPKDPFYSTSYFYLTGNLSSYRGGEEVLNTSQDNYSILLKNKLKWSDHSLEFGYNAYRSEHGHVRSSGINNFGSAYQSILSTLDLDTYTAQYHWQPENKWISLKANAFIAKTDNRVNDSIPRWELIKDPNMHPTPDKVYPSYLWTEATRKGITLSNRSQLHPQLSMEYGAAWVREDVGASSAIPPKHGSSWLNAGRKGWRQEYSLFSTAYWKPLSWLAVDGGLRWQHFLSQDNDTLRTRVIPIPCMPPQPYMCSKKEQYHIDPMKSSLKAWSPHATITWLPNQNWRIYGKYVQTARSPSIFETLGGLSLGINLNRQSFLPERGRNIELGATYFKEGLWHSNDKLRFHMAIFDNYIKDYITRSVVAQPKIYPTSKQLFGVGRVNLDYAKMRGGELTLSYDAGSWFGDISWNHYFSTMFCRKEGELLPPNASRCEAGGLGTSYALQHIPPKDALTLNMGLRLLNKKLLIGSRYTHIAKPAADGKFVPTGAGGVKPSIWKPYNIIDLYGSYQIGKQAEINFAIDNVGDRYYVNALNAAPLPAPGRTIRAGFTAKF